MRLKKYKYIAVMLLCYIAFCVSTTCVVYYNHRSAENQDRYDSIAELVQQDVQAADSAMEGERHVLSEYAAAYELNQDLVGWLQVPNTDINYPVVQNPKQGEDYYLDHDFMGDKSAYGCLFVRKEADPFAPSDNVNIFGHHMRDGSMFGSLDNYTDKKFWQENREFRFDTIYEHRTYRVFAVFITTATLNQGFQYYNFVDGTSDEFDAFVSRCKALSIYDTGITPEYGGKLVCLSTCEYSRQNGRLVVAAVLVDE